MPIATLPALSREYLRVDVEASGIDVTGLNLLPVEWAFLTTRVGRPDSGDWFTGDWEPGKAIARVLIGPGGVTTLTAGTYFSWLRITGAVETPVRFTGVVHVT